MALVLALGFEEGSGTTCTDSSGTGNDGTLQTGATRVAGQSGYGSAIQTDGANVAVIVPDSTSYKPTTAITVEAWVYLTTSKTWHSTVFLDRYGVGEAISLWAGAATANTPAFVVNSTTVNALSAIPNNEWHHIAGTYDGTTLRIFIDGVESNSAGFAGGFVYSNYNDLEIGANSIWDDVHVGRIDDVRIFAGEARTAGQITTDMNTPIAVASGATADLTGQSVSTTLNDVVATGDASLDLSGQSSTATLNNVSVSTGASFDLTDHPTSAGLGQLDIQTGFVLSLDGQSLSVTLDNLVVADNAYTIHGAVTPPSNSPLSSTFNMGVSFQLASDADLVGFRFWRDADDNISSKTAYLWAGTGTPSLIHSQSWTGLTGSGWQELTVSPSPIALTAGTTYTFATKVNAYGYSSGFFNLFTGSGPLATGNGATFSGRFVVDPAADDTYPDQTSNTSYFFDLLLQSDAVSASVDLGGQSLATAQADLDVVDNTTPAPDARTINIAADARIVFIEPALPGTFPPFTNSEVWVYGIPDLSLALGSLDASAVNNELVGHWQFNDDVTDATAYGNDGTAYNSPTYVTGQDGNAISFSAASSQYVEVARDSVFETQAITIALWVKPDGSQPAYTGIVKKSIDNNGTSPFGSWGLQFSGTAGTNLFFVTGHSGGPNDLYLSAITNDGTTWAHIVLTYDPVAGEKHAYINGSLDVSNNALSDAIEYDTTSTGNLFIGQSGNSASFYNGEVDDLRIYNYALDQTAVTALYNSYSEGDATTDLTGQSASLLLNDLAVVGDATLTLDTQSLTAALGAVDPQISSVVTLAGFPIGSTVGNLDATGSADITMDAQALSAALNALGVTGDVTLLLGDHSLTTAMGTVDVQAGQVTTTTIDSQPLAVALGNLSITTSASVALGTQALTANLGSLLVALTDLNVPAPSERTITISALSRDITIAAFDRSVTISAHDNTVTVVDQGRIVNILLR